MEKKRKVYAPFSLTSEAGVGQTPVEGYIDVNQVIYPTVNTGTVNENGKWAGVKSSDEEFIGLSRAEAVADGGDVLFPDTATRNHIDMTGFDNIFVAVKISNTGDYNIIAVMGPDTNRFANLQPVNAGAQLKGNWNGIGSERDFEPLLDDTESLTTADVWNIFPVQGRLSDQKNMQFKIGNRSGGISNIEFGFLRTVNR
jgi:hypothetical protein